ncbi:hypothetical protein H4582DRAFT_2055773 [Lactarius indigo]|nr:hypothetical protein H4582DRAFT_2055773 [Lactarius indigo]
MFPNYGRFILSPQYDQTSACSKLSEDNRSDGVAKMQRSRKDRTGDLITRLGYEVNNEAGVVLGVAVNLDSTVKQRAYHSTDQSDGDGVGTTCGLRAKKKADDSDGTLERRDREERMTLSHRGCVRSLPKW